MVNRPIAGRAAGQDEGQPRNADHRERAAQIAQPRRHRDEHRGGAAPAIAHARASARWCQQTSPRSAVDARGRPCQHGAGADLRDRRHQPRRSAARSAASVGIQRIHGRAARSIADGRRTVVVDARPEVVSVPPRHECPAIAGQRAVDRRRMHAAADAAPAHAAATPSTLTVAATSGPVSICSTPSAGAVRNPWTLQRDRGAGRPVGRHRPAVAGRRQVEEPGRELGQLVVRARHDRGAGRIGRAPVGAHVPGVRHGAGIFRERARRLEPDAPAVLHEQQRRPDLPRDQQEDARVRAGRAQEPRMKIPERRQHAGDEDRFRDRDPAARRRTDR